MLALLRSLAVFLIVFGAIFFVLYQMLSFFTGTRSVRRQFKKDLAYLGGLIKEFTEGLIPFEEEEFKILSSQPVLKSSRKSGAIYSKGVLSTIYQEPLIAFSIKHNPKEDHILMLAESDSKKYKLIYTHNGTEAFVDDELVGIINERIQFLPAGSDDILAEIQKNEHDKYAKILINDVDTAHINIAGSKPSSESDRVFSLFHNFEHKDSDEMIILTLYYLFIDSKAA